MKTKLFLLFVCALALFGASQTGNNYDWQTNIGGQASTVVVPTAATAVVAVNLPAYVKVDQINLHNNSAAAVAVTITDRSTNCNGSACPIAASPITIAANTTYTISLNGEAAAGGVVWSSTTANAVTGWIGGRY